MSTEIYFGESAFGTSTVGGELPSIGIVLMMSLVDQTRDLNVFHKKSPSYTINTIKPFKLGIKILFVST